MEVDIKDIVKKGKMKTKREEMLKRNNSDEKLEDKLKIVDIPNT